MLVSAETVLPHTFLPGLRFVDGHGIIIDRLLVDVNLFFKIAPNLLYTMNITKEHIANKRQVGTYKGNPVMEISTTGGLHLVVTMKGGSLETLGTGSHRAIARFIADKQAKTDKNEIKWTSLSKSDHVPYECFAHLLPVYEELTQRMRSLR